MRSVSTQAVIACLGCVGIGLSPYCIRAADLNERKPERIQNPKGQISARTNQPPASPEQFNPDPGVPPVRRKLLIEEPRFDVKTQISTKRAETNLIFNPDPGAAAVPVSNPL